VIVPPIAVPVTGTGVDALSLRAAAYRYPGGVCVGPVDLDVAAGELVLLTGPTGCGKSTVLRLAAGLLQRHGHGVVTGDVRVSGRDPAGLVAADRVRALGFVGQDPDDAVVSATCAAELAFGGESAGFAPARIEARVAELLTTLGLSDHADRPPAALSGGQRQRLVIGAALTAGAKVLLLDEPLSQLDPDGARAVMELLRGLAAAGHAILCVEHRLEIALPLATRTVLMDRGRVVADPLRGGGPLRALGLRGPALDELREHTGADRWRRRPGLTVDGIVAAGGTPTARLPAEGAPVEATPLSPAAPDPVLTMNAVSYAWPGFPRCLADVSLAVAPGERVALVGANGAGKSTLLGLLAGQLRPDTGTVNRAGRVVDVPQNPDLALFCETVADELAYGPVEARVPAETVRAVVTRVATALSVADLLVRPPQALSRGQRLRTAVAAALACTPRVLALDEPTSGQDRDQVDRMLGGLAAALPGGALVFASHDLDVVLRHATRVIVLDGGRVLLSGPPLPTLLAAAAQGLPLSLPPLAHVCAELGLPYRDPAALLDWLEASP
jgi:energy-coupling factor transport system ATP-binding protein